MMQINYDNHECKLCGRLCKNRRSLGNHLVRAHKPETIESYYLKFYLNGVAPKCACGCGKNANWHKTQYKYNKYLSGHNTSWTSENQPTLTKEQVDRRINAIKLAYATRGDEIKEKISRSLKLAHNKQSQEQSITSGLDPDIKYALDNIDLDIKDNSYRFLSTKQPLIARNQMIKINDKSLGGPGKEYTANILKPKLIKFFQAYVKKHGWWQHETKDTLEKVIKGLRKLEFDFEAEYISSLTRNGNDYLKSIFQSYWTVENGPAKLWFDENKLDKVLSYRLGLNNSMDYTYELEDGSLWTGRETFDISPHTLVRGFVVQRMAVSWFKPSAANYIYRYFLDDVDKPVVWDPSMGFGARMLGFVAACENGRYIGTDPATETYRDLLTLKNNIDHCDMFTGDIEPHKIGSEVIKLEEGVGDLVFTSPPYFSLERYYNEPGQCWKDYPELELWIEKYLIPTFQNAFKFLKQEKHMVINVNKDYFDIVMNAALAAGFEYKETLKLKTGRDHFSKKAGIRKMNFEPILVFEKPS